MQNENPDHPSLSSVTAAESEEGELKTIKEEPLDLSPGPVRLSFGSQADFLITLTGIWTPN